MADEAPAIELKTSTGSSDPSAGPGTDQRSTSAISVEPELLLELLLTLEIVCVAERAAVSAARLRGQGSEKIRRKSGSARPRSASPIYVRKKYVIDEMVRGDCLSERETTSSVLDLWADKNRINGVPVSHKPNQMQFGLMKINF